MSLKINLIFVGEIRLFIDFFCLLFFLDGGFLFEFKEFFFFVDFIFESLFCIFNIIFFFIFFVLFLVIFCIFVVFF